MAARRSSMGQLNEETIHQTNNQMADRELELLAKTNVNWQALKPKVGESQLYDRLIGEVQQATQKNESLAQLRSRLESLGKEGIQLAKQITSLL